MDGMPAAYVLGQKDFTSKVVTTSQSGLGSGDATNRGGRGRQSSVAYDVSSQRLFVVDTGNNRVLVYDLSVGIQNGMNATYVLGQPNFTSNVGATTQSGMRFPYGAFVDSANQRLFVNDSKNNRVLVYDLSGEISNGMNASYVLGQPNFTTGVQGIGQAGMWNPYGGVYDAKSQRLFVNDTGNSRVLVFDLSNGIKNGMNASHVLGQTSFTKKTQTSGQAGMYFPYSSTYDSTNQRLFVENSAINRVLVFDISNGIQNGMNATYVLGQKDFNSSSYALGQSQLWNPNNVTYDEKSQKLFVANAGSNSVLVYNLSNGIKNGMNAAHVLGQKDFNSNVQATTQSGMNEPEGTAYDPDYQRLFVADNGNSRVLVYNLATAKPDEPPAGYEDEVLTTFDTNPFPDTDINTLDGKAAAELYRRAVIGGFPDGEFKGDRPVNRAEAAKFLLLARFKTVAEVANNGQFSDVLDDQWYTKFVVTAAIKEIISGYPDGTFKPANTVNTAEFLKMLTLTFDLEENLQFSYSDVPADAWFARYVGTATRYNLFPKRTAQLMPGQDLTRYEVAVAIYQYLLNR